MFAFGMPGPVELIIIGIILLILLRQRPGNPSGPSAIG